MSSSVSSLRASSNVSSIPPSVQAPDSTRMALENCVARIKQFIQKVKLGIPSENVNLSQISCPITLEVPNDPVVTNCGHVYERVAIQEWRDKGGACTICATLITTLSPNHELRNLIEIWQKEDPILTCSKFKNLDQSRANKYLKLAKNFVDEKDYEEALEFYSKALQFTNESEVYAAIPTLYEQLGESKKATLSRLFLSLYQIQEGKIQEAFQTILSCESEDFKSDPLFVGIMLTLQSYQYVKTAEELTAALHQDTVENKISIYKQMIARSPDQFNDKPVSPAAVLAQEEIPVVLQGLLPSTVAWLKTCAFLTPSAISSPVYLEAWIKIAYPEFLARHRKIQDAIVANTNNFALRDLFHLAVQTYKSEALFLRTTKLLIEVGEKWVYVDETHGLQSGEYSHTRHEYSQDMAEWGELVSLLKKEPLFASLSPQYQWMILDQLGCVRIAGSFEEEEFESLDEGVALLTQSLEIRRQELGPQHPSVAISLCKIGAYYSDYEQNCEEALKYHTQALEIWKQVLGPQHPDVAISLSRIAAIAHKAEASTPEGTRLPRFHGHSFTIIGAFFEQGDRCFQSYRQSS